MRRRTLLGTPEGPAPLRTVLLSGGPLTGEWDASRERYLFGTPEEATDFRSPEAKYGVSPTERVPRFTALRGGPSDKNLNEPSRDGTTVSPTGSAPLKHAKLRKYVNT